MQRCNDVIEQTVKKFVDAKSIFSTVIAVSDGETTCVSASGEMQENSAFFIASTTKLYVSALMFILHDAGKLSLDDTLSMHFDATLLEGLHRFKEVQYAQDITLAQLLSHTSGIADYFEQKQEGKSLLDTLLNGEDTSWTFSDVIQRCKEMKPAFKPAAKAKALYSDTNFQLLGQVIEKVTTFLLSEALQYYIFDILQLT